MTFLIFMWALWIFKSFFVVEKLVLIVSIITFWYTNIIYFLSFRLKRDESSEWSTINADEEPYEDISNSGLDFR